MPKNSNHSTNCYQICSTTDSFKSGLKGILPYFSMFTANILLCGFTIKTMKKINCSKRLRTPYFYVQIVTSPRCSRLYGSLVHCWPYKG